MADNVIKIVPNELDGNSRYAIRLRSINSFGTVSDWSDALIVDTHDASSATGGRLALTANGMIAYDENGQTSFVYSGEGSGSRTNLITNPSFEVNASGWTSTPGATISRNTSDFFVGEEGYKASLKILANTATTAEVGAITATGDRIDVNPGEVYSVSAYVKASGAQVSLRIGLIFYSSSGTIIKSVYSLSPRIVSADGLWTRISSIATQTPNGVTKMGVVISSSSTMAANQYYLVDGVLAEEKSTLSDYFDGSTSIGATKWTGSAHYSTSIFDLSSPYFVDGGVFTAGTLQTAVDVGVPQAASPYYGKAGVKMSTSGVQGYSGLQATPSFSLATDGKFRVGNLANYMYWDGATLTIAGTLAAGIIDIGGFDATSFHVDAGGQMWLGASTYATAPLRISSTGDFYAKSFNLFNSTQQVVATLATLSTVNGSFPSSLTLLPLDAGWGSGGLSWSQTIGGTYKFTELTAVSKSSYPARWSSISSSTDDNLTIGVGPEFGGGYHSEAVFYNSASQASLTLAAYGASVGGNIVINQTGVILLSATNNQIQLSGTAYMNSSSATSNFFRPYDGANMHIRASTGSMYFDTNGTHYFRNIAGTNRMYIDTSGNMVSSAQIQTKQFYSTNQSPTTMWDTAQFVADGVSSGNATMSTRTNLYAVQFRQANAVNDLYIRNFNDSGWPIVNCDVVDASSRRYKRNIVPFGRALGSASETALSLLSKVEVVTYKRNKSSMIPVGKGDRWDIKRSAALVRLDEMRQAKRLPKYERNHECGVDCDCTPANPCQAMINEDKDLPGVIAEQLNEVLPGCTQVHAETGLVEGVKTLSLLAVTIKALQEMKDLVESLEAKIAVLEK